MIYGLLNCDVVAKILKSSFFFIHSSLLYSIFVVPIGKSLPMEAIQS